MVTADVPGDVGQQMHVGARRKAHPQIARLHVDRRRHGRHVGSQGELPDRQAQEEMVHRRIAHNDRIDDLGHSGFHSVAQLRGQPD